MNSFRNKYLNLKYSNKYFPNNLDIGLFVCTKECSSGYLDTSDYSHICQNCKRELKKIYSLNYKKISRNFLKNHTLLTNFNSYIEPKNGDYIDDISLDEFINGKVDCIGNVEEVYVALAVCTKECGNVQLIVDGSTQVCPKCGETMYRTKVNKYLLNN